MSLVPDPSVTRLPVQVRPLPNEGADSPQGRLSAGVPLRTAPPQRRPELEPSRRRDRPGPVGSPGDLGRHIGHLQGVRRAAARDQVRRPKPEAALLCPLPPARPTPTPPTGPEARAPAAGLRVLRAAHRQGGTRGYPTLVLVPLPPSLRRRRPSPSSGPRAAAVTAGSPSTRGRTGARRYCSAACRQRAFRRRKEVRDNVPAHGARISP